MYTHLWGWTTEGQDSWVKTAREVEEEEEGAVFQVAHPADLSMRVGRVNYLKLNIVHKD